ncbi:hypothetical protein Kpol_147p1 [Vanderwaltozyma polyspora DSM 70294]|uniref:Topoisomerase I damage affected protein 2 n=1 Tax=Vanderwaltozyma polyspora (strain ATCC 22028 / DSM 70294 / BCRC 21397 / CBS 2163 / NBRC 10782 / NRRL Y-8283 / UCD 57-17) TaxID=436907 RepID=TDA2_VANPO|nr:uncharacterized protein Kpol_147p1 [Vanderwaltozyma polyspora DSM 70294]A7TTT7.1 RecName: Full=Topoisomerase I damage affected protein 2 [Vanderwaltozyma polyspora DSM 70294]EDO14318.1 hypothetical protein Kpol_147p1 [Vanderwaltozyma polyspora DSM 70294]
MNVEIGNRSLDNENSPIPKEKLTTLIDEVYGERKEKSDFTYNNLIQGILEGLNKHSSFYKYIVTVTDVQNKQSGSNDFELEHYFGASWSSKKDGLFQYCLPSEEDTSSQSVVTIVWISKSI